MLFFTPLTVLCLAVTSVVSSPTPLVPEAAPALARRDQASITNAITEISNNLIELNNTVTEFYPSVPGTITAIKVAALAGDLKHTIDHGTNIVSQSEVLTQEESLPVAFAVINLSNEVFSSLNNIVSKKWAFDDAILGFASASPLVKLLLQALRSSTQEFGTTLTSKLDASLQGVAPTILTNIDNAFAAAIAAYST
ncbi:hypothetical protein DV738_g3245, partial [Chaetothyriales sp. CBS 135597]